MASVFELFGAITLRDEEYQRKLKDLESGTDRTGKSMAGSMDRSASDIEKRLQRLGEGMTRVGKTLSVAVTAPIVALAGVSLRAASNMEETAAKFGTVFLAVGDDAERAANRLRNSFGVSQRAAYEMLGATGDLLTGFGFAADEALDLSSRVNELAVDLASFQNYAGGASGASEALTSAMLGNTRAAMSLGIVIREEQIDLKLAEAAMRGLTFESSQQAKAWAVLEIATEQSKNAIGDFARTSDSFANQSRVLRARLEDLAVMIGTHVLPAATRLVAWLKDAVEWFTSLEPAVQKTIMVIAGVAAAVGPLLLAFGSLLKALPLLVSGFTALRTAMLFFTGPVGLAALAVTAFAALAMKLHGQRDSVAAAAEDLADSLAGAGTDTLVSALDAVIAKTDNDGRPALERLREDLIQTGDVAIEQAARLAVYVDAWQTMLREEQRGVLGFRSRSLDEQLRDAAMFHAPAGGDPTRGGGARAFFVDAIDAAFADSNVDEAMRLVTEAMNALSRAGMSPARFSEISAYLDRLEAGVADVANVALRVVDPGTRTGAPSGAGSGTVDTSGAGAKIARSVQDVFDDLAEKGAASLRVAAQLGTPEAAEDSQRERARLVASALRELLTDFDGVATQAQLDYLTERLRVLEAEPPISLSDIQGIADDPALTQEQRRLQSELIGRIGGENLERAYEHVERVAINAIAGLPDDADFTLGGEARRLQAELRRSISDDALKGAYDQAEQSVISAIAGIPDDADFTLGSEARRLQTELRKSITEGALEEAFRISEDLNNVIAGISDDPALTQAQRALQSQLLNSISGANLDRAFEHIEDNAVTGIVAIGDDLKLTLGSANRRAQAELRRLIGQDDLDPFFMRPGDAFRPPEASDAAQAMIDLRIRAGELEVQFGTLKTSAELEAEARRKAIDATTREATSRDFTAQALWTGAQAVGAFGLSVLDVAMAKIPALGAAIDGFSKGGPLGALAAVLSTMLTQSEGFANLMSSINTLLSPIVNLLGMLAQVIANVVNWFSNLFGIRREEEQGASTGAPGSLERLQYIRSGLVAARDAATDPDLIAHYNRRIAEIDRQIAEQQRHGLPVDAPPPPPERRFAAPGMREQTFGGVAQSVQMAVSVPLVEASFRFLDAVESMSRLFDVSTMDFSALPPFTSAIARMTPVLEQLLREGVAIHAGGTSERGSGWGSTTAALRPF